LVYLKDEGSTFDAPIEFVWKYLFGGDAHDAAHHTTRQPSFQKVSEITFEYASERLLRGQWKPDRMRISMFPPLSVVSEWLEGVLEGSKMAYLYAPLGERTRIDVYGEFTSTTLDSTEIEATVREFLDSEFRDDEAVIRREWAKSKGGRGGASDSVTDG